MESILFTVDETAKLLKTNKNYVYGLIKSGVLPALKLGSLKVRKCSIEQFLSNNENNDLSDPNNIKPLL